MEVKSLIERKAPIGSTLKFINISGINHNKTFIQAKTVPDLVTYLDLAGPAITTNVSCQTQICHLLNL